MNKEINPWSRILYKKIIFSPDQEITRIYEIQNVILLTQEVATCPFL
jgi:hypothetical protein